MTTTIEWTHPPGFRGATWNPTVGCTLVSPGCTHCYAQRMAARLEAMAAADRAKGQGPGRKALYDGTTEKVNGKAVWTGLVRTDDDALTIPLRTKTPTCFFVNSMSDLFHKDVPPDFIDRAFAVMALCQHHRFVVLTKRADRLPVYFKTLTFDVLRDCMNAPADGGMGDPDRPNLVTIVMRSAKERFVMGDETAYAKTPPLPLPNVVIGVSVEDQRSADERIPHLLNAPAACRAVSYEPALGPVDFTKIRHQLAGQSFKIGSVLQGDDGFGLNAPRNRIDWLIVGGESGPGARPCDVAWLRSAVEQCRTSGVPVFVKQLGTRPFNGRMPDSAAAPIGLGLRDCKGGDPDEWPADLRVREFPTVLAGTAAPKIRNYVNS